MARGSARPVGGALWPALLSRRIGLISEMTWRLAARAARPGRCCGTSTSAGCGPVVTAWAAGWVAGPGLAASAAGLGPLAAVTGPLSGAATGPASAVVAVGLSLGTGAAVGAGAGMLSSGTGVEAGVVAEAVTAGPEFVGSAGGGAAASTGRGLAVLRV